MSRPRYIVVQQASVEALLNLTEALAAALPQDSSDAERAAGAIEDLRNELIEYDSPFLRHREEILGGYSTAQRLSALTLHLWNDNNPVRLASLFGNADTRHTRIAMELIASYATNGENDPQFMNLADEIRDLKAVAAQAA